MERAIFLLEGGAGCGPGAERIDCMVNPQDVVLRRRSGIEPQRSIAGAFRGAELVDDPLLCVGGGTTELCLDLLFDVSMSGLPQSVSDVRTITERFWQSTEAGVDTQGRVSCVRFVWGRAWNFLGAVASLSERLEHFDETGVPRRSWLRMRLLRVPDRVQVEPVHGIDPGLPPSDDWEPTEQPPDSGVLEQELHRMIGPIETAGDSVGEPLPTTWLMELAEQTLGSAAKWRVIALENDLDDPLRIAPGTVLRVPVNAGKTS